MAPRKKRKKRPSKKGRVEKKEGKKKRRGEPESGVNQEPERAPKPGEPIRRPEEERVAAADTTFSPDVEEPPVPVSPVDIEPDIPRESEGAVEGVHPDEAGEEERKVGWTARLRRGLSKSRSDLDVPFERAKEKKSIGREFWEELEEALIAADVGVECASELTEGLKSRIKKERARTISEVLGVFREEIVETIRSFGEPPEPPVTKPRVLFVVGVNGVGKTTTAAKIGYRLKGEGKSVIFAAADTFRAAGIEQMEMWADRVGIPVVSQRAGSDPAAVVFDVIESAKAKGIDAVIVDTAGRLHTKVNLMAELNKMWRVAEREIQGQPETILVIDSTTGQNGISQAELFSEALPVGSIALTKLDGTAKGGIVLAIGKRMGIPVAYVGVGETVQDLHEFDPDEYAKALV